MPKLEVPVYVWRTFAMLLLSVYCCACRPITRTRHLPQPNPTEWVFTATPEAASHCVDQLGSFALDRWGNKGEVPYNTRGLVESTYGPNAVHSELYLFARCPLPLYATWHVRVLPEDGGRVRVRVDTEDVSVHNYRCFYILHPWGCARPVARSTMEEYRILSAIGRCLGASMPALVTPPGLVPNPEACEKERDQSALYN